MPRTDHIVMPEDHMDQLYTSGNPLVRFVHCQRLNAIVRRLPSRRDRVVLDAGCGEGHLIQRMHAHFPNYEYYGVDITPLALEKARTRCPYAQFQNMNLAETAYNDKMFDVIVCTEVLEHIYEYPAVLSEFKRILKKDGLLIVTFPNEPLWTISRFLLGRRPIKVPDHVNSFTPRAMRSFVSMKNTCEQHLPFGLPFIFSLNCLMEFQKE